MTIKTTHGEKHAVKKPRGGSVDSGKQPLHRKGGFVRRQPTPMYRTDAHIRKINVRTSTINRIGITRFTSEYFTKRGVLTTRIKSSRIALAFQG